MTKRLPRCSWCGGTIKMDDDDIHAHRTFEYEGSTYHLVECSTSMLVNCIKEIKKEWHRQTRTYDDYH